MIKKRRMLRIAWEQNPCRLPENFDVRPGGIGAGGTIYWNQGKVPKSYRVWCQMIKRCGEQWNRAFEEYGGKGIKVSDGWVGKGGYQRFLSEMGEPLPGMMLILYAGKTEFSKENCRWVTKKEISRPRMTMGTPPNPNSLRQKALAAGLSYHLVYFRIKKFGWSEERALSEPVHRKTDHRPTWKGERLGRKLVGPRAPAYAMAAIAAAKPLHFEI